MIYLILSTKWDERTGLFKRRLLTLRAPQARGKTAFRKAPDEGRRSHKMQFGRTFEEFEIGAIYKHWPGRTITEYDDTLFSMLTMNHNPLHIDANYCEDTE